MSVCGQQLTGVCVCVCVLRGSVVRNQPSEHEEVPSAQTHEMKRVKFTLLLVVWLMSGRVFRVSLVLKRLNQHQSVEVSPSS